MAILIIVVFSSITGCTNKVKEPMFSTELEYMTFDKSVLEAYCVVLATLDNIDEGETLRLYNFTLTEVLKGDGMPTNFSVTEGYGEYYVEQLNHSYTSIEPKYKVGNEYLLILSKLSSVYLDEDEYMDVSDVLIEVGKNDELLQTSMYHLPTDLSFKNLSELKSKVQQNLKNSKKIEAYGLPFSKSDNIDEIMEVTQHVYHVRIGGITIESKKSNRDTYLCEVIETIKGTEAKEIQVTLFKETVKIGEEYILLLNKGENSLLYALSSKNSVRDIEEKSNILSLIK